jgi:molybdopterin converting factor small subunit
MPKIIIPSSIRRYTDDLREITVEGPSFKDSIDELLRRYPQLESVMKNGSLLSFFVNNKLVKTGLEDWDSIQLNRDDEISLIVPIAGG